MFPIAVCLWLYTFDYRDQFDACCRGGINVDVGVDNGSAPGVFRMNCAELAQETLHNVREKVKANGQAQRPTNGSSRQPNYAQRLMEADPSVAQLILRANRLDCAVYSRGRQRFLADVQRMETATGLAFLGRSDMQGDTSWCTKLQSAASIG